MKLLPNMIAIILVPILLFVVLYIGPNAIVSCEWRKEQSAIENGMSTAIRVDFLEDYVVQVQPLYAEYLVNRRFIEIGGETKILFTYANSLSLLVSYALTTG
uniref:ABC transporter permease n=1 Tax=Ascaris lumbricoides TaxID=6252 RepID=A0A0M3HG04_ASCLU